RYGDQYIGCPLAAISITVCRGPQDDMNPEEVAEFLVHAINQHEKLVAERDGFTVDYCRVVDSLDECRARLAWVVEILGGDPNDGSSADSVSWSAWLSDEAVRLVTELVAERDELKRYVDKLPTYCAYCGFEVPIDDEAASKISEHIATCPKHPMRVIEAERDRLQAGAAVSECNRLRDLLQTCEAANKCLSMRVDVQATDLSQLKARNEKLRELAHLAYDVIEDDLEERPARHSLGNLSARLRTILVEEKP
ncbi:MAG TPA: hypothetical protein VFI02_11245, partial [Armatimonadota bacterium]|nr:hypothetical protein [Armatimonadota bacterium]